MRFLKCLVFFFLISVNVNAQQYHFIYLQAETKQAFYIKLNEKLFSSSASGYLIIPKLIAGSYKLTIGFPKNEWPSQDVNVIINDKDEGFLLKNFGEKGWGLFNLQTMEIVMGTAINTNTPAPVFENKTDVFSNTLAEVTNTPSIRQQEVATPAINGRDSVKPVAKEETRSPSQISQVFSIIDNSGRSVIYTVNDGNTIDSIRLFLPYDKESSQVKKPIDTIVKEDKDIAIAVLPDPEKKDSTINVSGTTDANTNKAEYKITILNPDCKSTATDDDYLKLLKKMAQTGKEEDMIAIARKAFRSKCYTTTQVKNLSMLLLKDQWKYIFYDEAYSHVSDIGNFKELQYQLTEEYYINRFKAMLR